MPPTLEFVEREVRPCWSSAASSATATSSSPREACKLVDRAAVLTGGDSGPAAVPGKPAESYLIETIGYRDALQMPPDGKLSDAQIATLTKWVELGLPWPAANPAAAAMAAKADGGRKPTKSPRSSGNFGRFSRSRSCRRRPSRKPPGRAAKSTATSLPGWSRPTCGMLRRPIGGR